MRILELDKLTVRSAGHTLLNGVGFVLNAGEIMSVIGPNGAGKSTLLHAVAGDIPSSEGQIHWHGLPNQGTLRARQLAVLPQFSLLSFPYQVHEVVALGRIPHATGIKADAEIVNQCLALMDISALSQRVYTTLSGGEKQRVQLARVIAQIWSNAPAPGYPRVLLLDEPTTALDLGHQHMLMSVLRELAAQNIAILMVLHDVNLAARCSDRMLALKQGVTVGLGSPEQVLTQTIIEELFETQTMIIRHPLDQGPMIIGVHG